MIPPIQQSAGRGGLPHLRSFAAHGMGEVYPAWASLDTAPLVGAAALGVVAGRAAGVAAVRP